MNYEITYEPNVKHESIQKLYEGLADYAKEQLGYKPVESFAFFIRDENNQIKGGVFGATIQGCLHTEVLWIDKSLRHQSYGSKLMQAAEQLGKEKGCLFATVNTMDWEALDFYLKLGYFVEFERKGYLKDSVFYLLRKDFSNYIIRG